MYWIDDRKEEKALLLCGFGTGDPEKMERTYGRLLEEARKENPAMAVRLALTSAKVIERLFLKNVLRLPDVRSALEEIAAGGAGEVRILPVQVVGGREYLSDVQNYTAHRYMRYNPSVLFRFLRSKHHIY